MRPQLDVESFQPFVVLTTVYSEIVGEVADFLFGFLARVRSSVSNQPFQVLTFGFGSQVANLTIYIVHTTIFPNRQTPVLVPFFWRAILTSAVNLPSLQAAQSGEVFYIH